MSYIPVLLQGRTAAAPVTAATATTFEEAALGIAPSILALSFPPSRVRTLSSSLAHKISSHDAMSRTKQSWNCSHQPVRAGIAHGHRMVRLHIGDCHVRVLIDDDNKNQILESCTPTLTNATPFAIWRTTCQGLLYISYLQAYNGGTRKITILSITVLPTSKKKKFFGCLGKLSSHFWPSEPRTNGQGLDSGTAPPRGGPGSPSRHASEIPASSDRRHLFSGGRRAFSSIVTSSSRSTVRRTRSRNSCTIPSEAGAPGMSWRIAVGNMSACCIVCWTTTAKLFDRRHVQHPLPMHQVRQMSCADTIMRAVFTSDLDLEPKWSDQTEPMSREKQAVTDNILHEQTHCAQYGAESHTKTGKKKAKEQRPQTTDQRPKTKDQRPKLKNGIVCARVVLLEPNIHVR